MKVQCLVELQATDVTPFILQKRSSIKDILTNFPKNSTILSTYNIYTVLPGVI